jgi:cytochrome c oxidase subunit 2
MNAPVIVKSAEDFEAWVTGQQAPISDDPVERGKLWYSKYGCMTCHSVDGSEGIGPTLFGIYGETVALADGSTVVVDEAFLIDSIRQPGKQIVKGFSNIMPAGSGNMMTDQQLADIIDYIKSLK